MPDSSLGLLIALPAILGAEVGTRRGEACTGPVVDETCLQFQAPRKGGCLGEELMLGAVRITIVMFAVMMVFALSSAKEIRSQPALIPHAVVSADVAP